MITRFSWPPAGLVVAALLLALRSAPATAQLGGSWNVAINGCFTDSDGVCDCVPGAATIEVTQVGNQLSGWLSLESTSTVPDFCSVTCIPNTPGCTATAELTGTVSGNSVTFTIEITQALQVICDVLSCDVHESYADSFHAQGTIAGRAISGTFTETVTDSCTGTQECVDLANCVNSTGSGTFEARVSDTTAASPVTCIGDCDHSRSVVVDEVKAGLNTALGNVQATTCHDFDVNGDHEVKVDDLLQAINAGANLCVLPLVDGCELGDPCTQPGDCAFRDCGGGVTAAACVLGRCLTGTCACADDIPTCCEARSECPAALSQSPVNNPPHVLRRVYAKRKRLKSFGQPPFGRTTGSSHHARRLLGE